MGLIKCPRCELNYMKDTDVMCSICKREMRGEIEQETVELCSECGENPVVPGQELCAYCMKEFARRHSDDESEATIVTASAAMEINSVSEMDEIVPEIEDDDMEGMDFSDEDEDDEDEEAED